MNPKYVECLKIPVFLSLVEPPSDTLLPEQIDVDSSFIYLMDVDDGGR